MIFCHFAALLRPECFLGELPVSSYSLSRRRARGALYARPATKKAPSGACCKSRTRAVNRRNRNRR